MTSTCSMGAEIAEKGVADVSETVGRDAVSVAEGACSFLFTTKVATKVGEQAIGTLKVGEKVLAYNPKTKKMELKPILHVWIHQDNDLVDLTITHTITKQGKETKPVSEVIHTNKKHPFLTVDKGFVPVGQIKLGMHVVEASGQVGVISGWKVVPGVKTMYNLEVAQDHTFVVGVGMWVVHNCTVGDANQLMMDAANAPSGQRDLTEAGRAMQKRSMGSGGDAIWGSSRRNAAQFSEDGKNFVSGLLNNPDTQFQVRNLGPRYIWWMDTRSKTSGWSWWALDGRLEYICRFSKSLIC